jgi:DNA invertase Pin-like site-specific DNA recombinase
MLFRMMAVLAEFERDIISERTAAALRHKRAKGERTGQVPYGQSLAPDGRTLVRAPEEWEAIAYARGRRAAGASLRAIAAELDARGVRPKNGGGRGAPNSVKRIIQRKDP